MAEKEEKTFELKLNSDYYVVTANDLIKGRQKMSLREAQLLYIAMAQVVKEDKDFKTYKTTVPELAAFMGIDPKGLVLQPGLALDKRDQCIRLQLQ